MTCYIVQTSIPHTLPDHDKWPMTVERMSKPMQMHIWKFMSKCRCLGYLASQLEDDVHNASIPCTSF